MAIIDEYLVVTRDFKGLPFQRPDLSTKIVPLEDYVYGLKVLSDII